MNKISKILLGITLAIIGFGLSAFGMYKYNEIKIFNNLASQGKQYMIQKNYDKAIQAFQQALGYKNDTDIQSSLALAQNLKNEESKKGIISKNIQLANDSAKNNKYDEANKYLDEILKVDPNNLDAKNLKDIFAKAVQDQQEKVKNNQTVKYEETSTNKTKNAELTYEQAFQMVQSVLKKEFKNKNMSVSAIPIDEIPEKFRVGMIDGEWYTVSTIVDNDYGGPDYRVNKYTGKIIEYSQGIRRDIN